jgi:transcription antitermination factor NusG
MGLTGRSCNLDQSTVESHAIESAASGGSPGGENWYALRTRSRHEKIVRDRLSSSGFEPFLPLARTIRQWSDRRKSVEMPLFSGYCFARFALEVRYSVLQIPGIVNIVGTAIPEPILPEELDAIKLLVASDRSCDPHAYLTEGVLVEVVRGPLSGLRGQLVRKAGRHCIVIRVHLIQQAVAVHIDAREVVPVV